MDAQELEGGYLLNQCSMNKKWAGISPGLAEINNDLYCCIDIE